MTSMMKRPHPRGPLSAAVLDALAMEPDAAGDTLSSLRLLAPALADASDDILQDGDLQLALFCLYELHYGGLEGADDDWEWNPELLAVRADIERVFEAELRRRVEVPPHPECTIDDVAALLFTMTSENNGPTLSRYVAKVATQEQLGEFLVQRSIYQLREADPHTWAIPRLTGRPKAALVEIQADEYGGGRPERMHSELFARTMRGLGLDDDYGHYVDGAHARLRQRDVPLRPAPAPARCHRRASRSVRDDLVRAQPPVRQRLPASRLRQ
jgi:hypothetical protein